MKTLHLSIIAIASIAVIGIILFAIIPPSQPKKIEGLDDDTGIVTIGIQSYYFTTVNDTMTTVRGEGVRELFHNVVFTFFPSPPYMAGFGSCGGISFSSDVKFSDGIHELLKAPVLETPCKKDYFKANLSNHTNPQAGLAVYNEKIKLLVSTKNESSTEISLLTPIKDCNKKKDLPDMGCFIESFKTCSPATVQQTRSTVEGDPISVTAIIESNASNECKIHVHYDSKDRYGFQGQYDSLCNNIRAIDKFYWVIDQCENKEYVFNLFTPLTNVIK